MGAIRGGVGAVEGKGVKYTETEEDLTLSDKHTAPYTDLVL